MRLGLGSLLHITIIRLPMRGFHWKLERTRKRCNGKLIENKRIRSSGTLNCLLRFTVRIDTLRFSRC